MSYCISRTLHDDLLREQGVRRTVWITTHWRQWVSAGSYINVYPDKGSERKPPRGFTPEQLAKLDEFLENLATIIPELLLPIEPDGVVGYEHTIEARYGVPVGADWLPVAARRKVAVSLFHPAMLCEAA